MNIKNVKVKDGVTTVQFSRLNGKDAEATTFASKDVPRKEFRDAMESLTNDLLAACELPAECREGTEALSVALGSMRGQRTVIISGRKRVEAGTFAISTPLLVEYEQDEGQANGLPSGTAKLVDLIIKEAKKYVAGERTQGDLFDGQDSEAGEEALEEEPVG